MKDIMIDALTNVENVSENMKDIMIDALTNVENVSENMKDIMIDALTNVENVDENMKDIMIDALTNVENVSANMKDIMDDAISNVERTFYWNGRTKSMRNSIEDVLTNMREIVQETFTSMNNVDQKMKELTQDEITVVRYRVSQIKSDMDLCWKAFRSRIKILQDACTQQNAIRTGINILHYASTQQNGFLLSEGVFKSFNYTHLESILQLLKYSRNKNPRNSAPNTPFSLNNRRKNRKNAKEGIQSYQTFKADKESKNVKGRGNEVIVGRINTEEDEDIMNLRKRINLYIPSKKFKKYITIARRSLIYIWNSYFMHLFTNEYDLNELKKIRTIISTALTISIQEPSTTYGDTALHLCAFLYHSNKLSWFLRLVGFNDEQVDQGMQSEKKDITELADGNLESKSDITTDSECNRPRCTVQDISDADTSFSMNGSDDARNKLKVKTDSYVENLDANVYLLTFTPDALPRYSYHRDMIVDVQNSFKVSVLDGRTPERGQVVVICRDEMELRDIQAFISDEQPENRETTSLVKAADMVDCIVLSENLQGCTMKVDQILKQHFSGKQRQDVQLCILTLGLPTPTWPRSDWPDDDRNLRYINVPAEIAPIRQFVSSALEMRFLKKLENFKAQQLQGKENKKRQLRRVLREAETIENSLKHYSVLYDVPQNVNAEIPDVVMTVIKKHEKHIQSYGMRMGVIKIRVNQEQYQVVSEDIKSTGIDVDIRSVDITMDPIVPFAQQGCRLIRSDKKYGTLGTFANYTVRSGEKKLVALTCAHVCSRGDKVSVDLNNKTKPFGTCIDDTCSRQGSEQAHSDLSVIQIETEMHKNCARRHLYRKNLTEIKETYEAKVCEDLNAAPPGKVHKVGARTGWTHGEIIGYENIFRKENDKFWSYFLVHSNNKSSKFAEGGDSGAVVSTVRFDKYNREHALYLGMVFGGPINNDKLVRALPSDSPPSRPISCREDDENTPHAESMRDDDSIDSMDSSDDIYCTVLQTDLQSLYGDVSFDLR